jgi:hypothetical protein
MIVPFWLLTLEYLVDVTISLFLEQSYFAGPV